MVAMLNLREEKSSAPEVNPELYRASEMRR